MIHRHFNYNSVKNFMGRAYHTGKNILGHIDHSYNTARKIYDIAQPALQHFAPETKKVLDKNLSKAATDYENIRHKVVDTHNQVAKHLMHHHAF